MKKKIFIVAFLFACLFQAAIMYSLGFYDQSMWANQAKYVQTGDPREFNAAQAYGHPGGPVIDGIVAVHGITRTSYDTSIIIFLTLFNGLLVGCISLLCYVLSGEYLWSLAVLGTLAGDALYEYATPPSAVVALLVVLLCLLTLYIYKQTNAPRAQTLALWSLVAGMAVATRADIGTVSTFVFIFLLKHRINWKQFFYVGLGAFVSFWIFDPFMWFMPVKHIGDLVGKVVYHYAEYIPIHMNGWYVLSISSLTIVSIFLSLALIAMRKKILSPVPPIFVLALIIMTSALYDVFLTARYQAERYFMPLTFMWQVFLSLFVFTFIDRIQFDFLKTSEKQERARYIVKVCIVIALIVYPLIPLSQSIWFDYVYHALPWQQ